MKVYGSITSIFQNQSILLQTLKSLHAQTNKLDKIYVYLSETPYLIDTGFEAKTITFEPLADYLRHHTDVFQLEWTENIGSYRKLLPLLQTKWEEDCLILTFDDDTEYHPNLVATMRKDYEEHTCVINYRGFTPNCQHLQEITYENRKPVLENKSLWNFPTGKGGVLYHPSFFHATKNLIFEKALYTKHCATADDIWFFLVRVCNNVPCYLARKPWMTNDRTQPTGLCFVYNVGLTNTNNMQNTIRLLQDLQYL